MKMLKGVAGALRRTLKGTIQKTFGKVIGKRGGKLIVVQVFR